MKQKISFVVFFVFFFAATTTAQMVCPSGTERKCSPMVRDGVTVGTRCVCAPSGTAQTAPAATPTPARQFVIPTALVLDTDMSELAEQDFASRLERELNVGEIRKIRVYRKRALPEKLQGPTATLELKSLGVTVESQTVKTRRDQTEEKKHKNVWVDVARDVGSEALSRVPGIPNPVRRGAERSGDIYAQGTKDKYDLEGYNYSEAEGHSIVITTPNDTYSDARWTRTYWQQDRNHQVEDGFLTRMGPTSQQICPLDGEKEIWLGEASRISLRYIVVNATKFGSLKTILLNPAAIPPPGEYKKDGDTCDAVDPRTDTEMKRRPRQGKDSTGQKRTPGTQN